MAALAAAVRAEMVAEGGVEGEQFDMFQAARMEFEERRNRLVSFDSPSMGEGRACTQAVPRARGIEFKGGRRRVAGKQLVAVGRIIRWQDVMGV